MTTTGSRLERELANRSNLRPPEIVMAPEMLGAARLTRYSFSRMLLRTAFGSGWQARRVHFDLDEHGQGEAIYEWEIDGEVFSFVAFTKVLDESHHTDRVIADDWEISGALVEGRPDASRLALLREQVPRQERGRLDPGVLVLTRGNRSVRFFDELVERLANGHQPDPDRVGDAGYIMRSTAFYGNGKFGMRSFDALPGGHPFAVPYRAQFATAWLFRELSYDSVEHCARARGGNTAVGFDDRWRRFFGLGNATGLGLVPYAFKHPDVLHAWASVREIALADVRATPATAALRGRLSDWIERARAHFATGTDDDCTPFRSPIELVPVVDAIAETFATNEAHEDLFDRLYSWAEDQGPETAELVVSLLIELHEGDDHLVDELLTVAAPQPPDPAMSVGDVRRLLDERFDWTRRLALDGDEADTYWWVLTDNNEEPRRVRNDLVPADGRALTVDVAHRIRRLDLDLGVTDPADTVADLLGERPELRSAVERVAMSGGRYGEPRDNACGADFLPLQTQRFQLAFYGMDNFKPKSTDWLRVTLFQGAPRVADLAEPATFDDRWVLPLRPGSPHC